MAKMAYMDLFCLSTLAHTPSPAPLSSESPYAVVSNKCVRVGWNKKSEQIKAKSAKLGYAPSALIRVVFS